MFHFTDKDCSRRGKSRLCDHSVYDGDKGKSSKQNPRKPDPLFIILCFLMCGVLLVRNAKQNLLDQNCLVSSELEHSTSVSEVEYEMNCMRKLTD